MEKFNAKLIPAPRITLGSNQAVDSGKESFFNLFAQPIYSSKHSLKVGMIYFRNSDVNQIIDLFQDTSRKLKIEFRAVKISGGDFDQRKAVSVIDECVYKAA